MRFSATFATLAILVAPIFAAPSSLLPVETYKGETTGKYIVRFKEGVSRKSWVKKLGLTNSVDWSNVNGLASKLSTDALNQLRASDDVEFITEDGIVSIAADITQENAPWGLSRLSSLTPPTTKDTSALTYPYVYDESAGEGVDIYIADTGIYVNHTEFEGRATWGWSAFGVGDGHGHGTHCAGTAAGATFGIAKKANLIAVKVLSDSGSGSVSGIVSGFNWIIDQVAASGRPSIVSLSLGGSANTALDNGIKALTDAGIHAIVAAGNSNANAANYSPARAPSAITVGSSTISDAKSSFSNYGAVVDVFAPGTEVVSSWIGNPAATNKISGTSMATPHISGLAAYLIAKDGNLTPEELSDKIKELAIKDVITGLPSGTPNLLANNGI